ncbi:MAG: hypothetical protein VX730_06760 [Pseudomonadota bacterium]|nr:hypothetical protein [Pseudomonadota bacterium]
MKEVTPREMEVIGTISHVVNMVRVMDSIVAEDQARHVGFSGHVGSSLLDVFTEMKWSYEELCMKLYADLPSQERVTPVRGEAMSTYAGAVYANLDTLLKVLENDTTHFTDSEKKTLSDFLRTVQKRVCAPFIPGRVTKIIE